MLLVLFLVGTGLVFLRISSLLTRYQATNDMIKDTSFIVRKDNSPIDGDKSVNGMKLYGRNDFNNDALTEDISFKDEIKEYKEYLDSEVDYVRNSINTSRRNNGLMPPRVIAAIFVFVFVGIIAILSQILELIPANDNSTYDYNYYDDNYYYLLKLLAFLHQT